MIARGQLLRAGAGTSTISRWVAVGRLHRLHPGVYAVGHAAVSREGRLTAALLYGGDQAMLSHTTAGWVWSLIDAEPTRVHLTVPGRRRSLPGVRVHQCRLIESAERKGFPVTPVAWTLLDLASVLPFRQVRRTLAEADYRGVLDVAEIRSVLRKGRRGSRALRAALDAHLPDLAKTLSELEERFLVICQLGNLPTPEVNGKLGGMRVDALWRAQRLAVELDGAAGHGGWAQASRDRDRDLVLRRLGFRVVRYTWRQITGQSAEVIADLRRQLDGP